MLGRQAASNFWKTNHCLTSAVIPHSCLAPGSRCPRPFVPASPAELSLPIALAGIAGQQDALVFAPCLHYLIL